ncbi:5-formyltetrahydrofolate cyclo-ligase [Aeromonas diversa]|uniref:5-formyltetrahydrofolate cyclo-ligase n=1 Tax=Aeromonas diversa CDC 2478-85 TaxID=1268237 RepID=N9U4J2_9GAMM|nr:5-formyltetrahydrofolate cyclo-ligase [Aeromonas diversa]ENY73305.1 5-formyltetrahydrofolate cyclo-ligase family protein [Aeromonas diversa CDC 2478-85]
MSERHTLRQQIRERRRALTAEQQHLAAQALLERIKSHPDVAHARRIAFYLANDGEINPLPTIHWLWAQKKEVYLPVVHPFTPGHLLFLHYTPTSPMVRNKFRIEEPELDMERVIPYSGLDLMFTPMVAFDADGNRLGMGGGYYDRTLACWQQHQLGPKPIGVAHDCQLVDKVPSEEWDIPLPELLTPSRHWQFKKT